MLCKCGGGIAMRLLFITPYVPSRIRVRPFHLIKSLASLHEISLVSLLCDDYEAELAADIKPYCTSIDLIRLPKWQAYKNCLSALLSDIPLRVAYYQSRTFEQRILRIIQERKIEVVHGELIKIMPALRSILARLHIPVLYDSVDCISSYLEQQYKTASNPLQRAFVFTELKKMRRYEQQSLALLPQIAITSAVDRDHLNALCGQPLNIQVVPNGVDTDYFRPSAEPRDTDSLVFCAKMDYYPNAQAILHFCQEVLPSIWKLRPHVRLTIVGNNPPRAVQELAEDQRITVTGFVPDIRPYLRKASVALAPLLVAAGMQNKVLEALAMKTPMVATPHACRSLCVKDGVHLYIAENAQMYAYSILRLLEEPEIAQQLGEEGRQYVEQYHSWMMAAQLLTELYRKLGDRQHGQSLVKDCV